VNPDSYREHAQKTKPPKKATILIHHVSMCITLCIIAGKFVDKLKAK
jgi:hypothetical protein